MTSTLLWNTANMKENMEKWRKVKNISTPQQGGGTKGGWRPIWPRNDLDPYLHPNLGLLRWEWERCIVQLKHLL